MTLSVCRDLAAADWIARSELPWQRLVGFGPAGFDAYARPRFLPDPTRPGQDENAPAGEGRRSDQLPALFEVLAAHTTTPDDCYFCVWEGYAASPTAAPPQVVVPHRAYWLFRGPLADVGTWDTAAGWPRRCRLGQVEAAFAWPADRAWCVAHDVDPHWAGIGGTGALIAALATDRRLDAVAADPTQDQPSYG
jgi:hypothetical protein